MQCTWDKLVDIHASLAQGTVHKISPQSWHDVVSETLSSSSPGNVGVTCQVSSSPGNAGVMCHVSPAMCQHCHQMTALSAVSLVAQMAKSNKGGETEELYLLPLLDRSVLDHMLELCQHCCQFLRHQARKAIIALCSLTALSESTARHVVSWCVQAILTTSPEDGSCLEPLQLLSCLLSSRSGCSHRLSLPACILPFLPALYHHCCHSRPATNMAPQSSNLSAQGTATSMAQSSRTLRETLRETYRETGAVLGIQSCPGSAARTKSSFCGSSQGPPCKQPRTDLQEKLQSQSSILHREEKVLALKLDVNDPGYQAKYEGIQQPGASNSELGNTGRHVVTQIHEDEKNRSHSNASVHVASHQTLMTHYEFLCLVQKLTKLCNSLEASERVTKVKQLQSAVLTQLIADHTALFSQVQTQLTGLLLVERKYLDVVDTLMDYGQLRTGRDIPGVYTETAAHFVCCMQQADCCWRFPDQATLIGGQLMQAGDVTSTGVGCGSGEEEGGSMVMRGEHSADVSPVLVLLIAVVVKSCAVVCKAEKHQPGSQNMMGCVRLLHWVHCHLCQVCGGDRGEGGQPLTCAHWLGQVCGGQDDRWTEALLCLLDIFLCLQSVEAPSEVLQLLAVLDPHTLFLQLLELTGHDSSLLIDWLTSPETCFLAYLTRYLRLMAADFRSFVRAASCQDPASRCASLVCRHPTPRAESAHTGTSLTEEEEERIIKRKEHHKLELHVDSESSSDNHGSSCVNENDQEAICLKKKEEKDFIDVKKNELTMGLTSASGGCSDHVDTSLAKSKKATEKFVNATHRQGELKGTDCCYVGGSLESSSVEGDAACDTTSVSTSLSSSQSGVEKTAGVKQSGDHNTAGVSESGSHSLPGAADCDTDPVSKAPQGPSEFQNTVSTAGVHSSEKPSLGMALLSCYDGSSDSDSDNNSDRGDQVADEAVTAAGSFGERDIPSQRNVVLHFSEKHEAGIEGEGKPRQTLSSYSDCNRGSNDDVGDDAKDYHDDDRDYDDDVDSENEEDADTSMSDDSSSSQTDSKERFYRRSQSEYPEILSTTPQPRHSGLEEGREATRNDCNVGRVSRVMHLVSEVGLKLERLHKGGLLVYNPRPLLCLITACQQQYRSHCAG